MKLNTKKKVLNKLPICGCSLSQEKGLGSGWIKFKDFWEDSAIPKHLKKVKTQVDKPGLGGVYAIRIAPSNSNNDCSIVSIGKSKDLSVRLGSFLAGALGFGAYHSEGNTFAKEIRVKVRPCNLEFTFMVIEGDDLDEKLKDAECLIFHEFIKNHGNKPKLNQRKPPGYRDRYPENTLRKLVG